MMRFLSKKYNIVLTLVVLMLLLSACAKKTEEVVAPPDNNFVYYLSADQTRIEPVLLAGTEYDLTGLATDKACEKAIAALSTTPNDEQLINILGSLVTLNSYKLDNGLLLLDFSAEYSLLSKTNEILFRASLVRTLDMIDGVDSVTITVDGEELLDSAGNPITAMVADAFIDNSGDEMNAYEETLITLYFATEDGKMLSKESREVVYSSNISTEKLVLEELIKGPQDSGLSATIASDRKVNSVMTKDGICYVNLSDPSIDSLSLFGNSSEEISVYSIVNTLCELPNINKVQISIDGISDRLFRDSIRIDQPFERNLDIIE